MITTVETTTTERSRGGNAGEPPSSPVGANGFGLFSLSRAERERAFHAQLPQLVQVRS